MRRTTGSMLTLLIASVFLSADVAAQTPSVVSSSVVSVPNSQANGAPWQSSVSNRGDFLLFDFKTSGFYQFPPNGGAQITLGAPGAIAGGFTDSGIAVDPRNNNIYLNNNYNGGLLEFPYDAAKGTWDLPSVVVAGGLAGNLGGSCGNYFQSAGMSMNKSGILAVATENGCGVEIFTVPVDASGTFGAATPIVSNMKQRAKTVAIDDAGNIYYNADAGGFAGVGFIPAGTTGLANETSIARIDPMLGNVQGVTVDKSGNAYIADGTAGEYLVPLENGVPNPAHAVLLSPAPANGGPSLDQAHGVLFIPTGGYAGLQNEIDILLNRVEFGATAVGTTGATAGTVTYSFSSAITPASFVIVESGSTGDFAVGDTSGCGVTSTATAPYAAGSNCSIPVTFTPRTVGDISATLLMLDASGTVLASTTLHGSGLGSAIVAAPGTESAIGSGLQTPSQLATDAAGNVYVADSGLGKVLKYAQGASASTAPVGIGNGLTAPSGVAVDGAGDVFIADSGAVIEVPFSPSGLNAAGQFTLKSGLGTNLKLAVDELGDVFVGDPDNQQVVKLRSLVDGVAETDFAGFTQLSAIAADGSGDVFVANGTDLIEISSTGVQTTLLTSLSGANGLAVDASGSVYVTETSGTVRIPNEGGTLTPADKIAIASGVTTPTAVAVDSVGSAYVADGTAKNVDYVNVDGFLNLGTLTSTTGTQSGTVTIVNKGNSPLNITAFASTADFSETGTTCIGAPIAIGSSCTATVTFNPGPGDQGTLTALLAIASDAANAPVGINVAGVGAALAASASVIKVSAPTVTNAPVVVTVAAASGTGLVPTGNATLTATANGVVATTITLPLVNGTVTFNATDLQPGTYTFKVSYAGDRVYGTSIASAVATVSAGAVLLTQPPAASVPKYVLASGTGSQEPYDGSDLPYDYVYPVVITSADGNPLLGVPIYNAKGAQISTNYGTVTFQVSGGSAACPPVNVNADGTVPFATKCFSIDTSNNQIPDLMTTYTVTPVFTGPNYASVTGVPVTFIALRNPMVIITSNPASLSITNGSTATANLTLTSLLGYGVAGANGNLNNYSLPVELECDGLPAHASCSFAYPNPDPSDASSVAVTPTTPGQVVMTINTNVPVGTTPSASLRESPVVFAAMFGVSLLGLAFGRKRGLRVSLFNAVCLLFLSGMVAGVVACGSGTTGNTPILTTPTGTYSVTVTAKQVGSRSIPGSTPGTIVVVQGNGNQMSIPFTVSVAVQ